MPLSVEGYRRKNRLLLLVLCLAFLFAVACGREPEPTPTAGPSATPRPSRTPTRTPTPAPTVTPTLTPTPRPLAASAIFDLVSPAIAYIESPAGSGSGLLYGDNYIVTNAHVVWPFAAVRVVFSDGSEHLDVPIVNWDLMTDLAVLGPIETSLEPLPLGDGESLIIGSDAYLIGYPGEVERFPKPTITRGLISRVRQWEALDMTYFQTDAAIAGGQSGGVLVSDRADVIGISGFSFTEAGFGLVASAVDLEPRIEGLIAGEDMANLIERRLPFGEGRPTHTVILNDGYDRSVYVLNEPAGTELEIEVRGADGDIGFVVLDPQGQYLIYADEQTFGSELGSATTEVSGPHFVEIYQNGFGRDVFSLRSSHDLSLYRDPDDGLSLLPGWTHRGSLDYPGDVDYYSVYLSRGRVINIQVDSVLINPYLEVGFPGARRADIIADDNSGGGVFGLNAELTYRAPHTGDYFVSVQGSYYGEIGGYIMTLGEPYEGAPTPISPPPLPTPIASDYGPMNLYQSEFYPFAIQYPATWLDFETSSQPQQGGFCATGATCFYGLNVAMVIVEQKLDTPGLEDVNLDAYGNLLIAGLEATLSDAELLSREEIITAQGTPAILIDLAVDGGTSRMILFAIIYERMSFAVLYGFPAEERETLQPLIDYSIQSFTITDE